MDEYESDYGSRSPTAAIDEAPLIALAAGVAASAPDAAYEAVGCDITDAAGAFGCELVLKVRPPAERELPLLRSGTTLVGMLNPFDQAGLQRLAAAGVTGLIEVAPAGALTGLAKRGLKGVPAVAVKTPDDLAAAFDLIDQAA